MRGRLLDLANVDLHGLESQAHRCDSDGVSISTLSELRLKNSDADAQIIDAYLQSQTGWLDPDPYMVHNLQDAERRASSELVRNARPDRLHVALVNGQPVGVSGETMGTAVLPDYRRRGIAGALLAARIAGLKREGAAVFFSSSAQPAFIRIYDRLGCQDWFSEIRFVKRVES
ncbi:MAG: GNAT family N-acetyltransferase [Chthoniobacteraceae bacterium]